MYTLSQNNLSSFEKKLIFEEGYQPIPFEDTKEAFLSGKRLNDEQLSALLWETAQSYPHIFIKLSPPSVELLILVKEETGEEQDTAPLFELARYLQQLQGSIGFGKVINPIYVLYLNTPCPSRLKEKEYTQKEGLSFWEVNTVEKKVTCFQSSKETKGFIKNIKFYLENPEVKLEAVHYDPSLKTPFTTNIIIFNVIIFLLTIIIARTYDGEAGFRLAMIYSGAFEKTLILDHGQWYRLLIPGILHWDFIHLAMNSLMLIFAGSIVERLAGYRSLLFIYSLGLVGGSLGSLLTLPELVLSAGASGAITGIIGGGFVLSYRLNATSDRLRVRLTFLQWLILSVLPLSMFNDAINIDYAAHTGGAMGGALAGYLLYRQWPFTLKKPKFLRSFWVVQSLLYAFLLISIIMVSSHLLQRVSDSRPLLPALNEDNNSYQIPMENVSPQKLASHFEAIASRYPEDYRANFFAYAAALDAKNHEQANFYLKRLKQTPETGLMYPNIVKHFQKIQQGLPPPETLSR